MRQGQPWHVATQPVSGLSCVRPTIDSEAISGVTRSGGRAAPVRGSEWHLRPATADLVAARRAQPPMQDRHRYAARTLAFVALTLSISLFGGWLSTQYADAASDAGTSDVYSDWRPADGTICVQYGATGYWPVSTAVNEWNRSEANIVRRSSCSASGFPRNRTVVVVAYKRADRTCGYLDTGSWTSAEWRYVTINGSRVAMWTPQRPIVWLNLDPSVRSCFGTYTARARTIRHEIGHLWLDHGAGGVMTGCVCDPIKVVTTTNIAQVNGRY